LQDGQVLSAGRPLGVSLGQQVVRLAEAAGRIQVRAVAVAGQGSRLAHQPVDHVPVIDVVLIPAAQARRRQLQLFRVPDFDGLHPESHFHPFADQTRRHRIGVVLHPQGTALADLDLVTNHTLHTPDGQRLEPGSLFGQTPLPSGVATILDAAQPSFVLGPAGEVPAATQEQRLLHRFLEAPVGLLAIPILVSAGRVGRLGLDPVVAHERPVVLRELFRMAVLVHGQTHAVIAMPLGRRSQGPQGVLQALAETGEALRKAHRDVFPVRVGQHEVVQ
jgi:hypothetical protein